MEQKKPKLAGIVKSDIDADDLFNMQSSLGAEAIPVQKSFSLFNPGINFIPFQDRRRQSLGGQTPMPFDVKKRPLLIGVTGGTAGGKTSICDIIKREFQHRCCVVTFDNFYKGLSDEDHANAENYNFDSPNALDFDLAYEAISNLLQYKDVEIPIYDFATHKRVEGETLTVKCQPLIIFEGIMSLYEKRFRDLMDLKIFVLTDDDIRLARRIQRDIAERGRTVQDVLTQYNRFVKSSYDEFIKPTMKYADIIIPFGRRNTVAIDFVVTNLKSKVPMEKIINKEEPDTDSPEHSPNKGQGNMTIPLQKIASALDASSENDLIVKTSQEPNNDVFLRKILAAYKDPQGEEAMIRGFYLKHILQSVAFLSKKCMSRENFNPETQIFIPEIISQIGQQSALDFVQHSPFGKKLEIFTIMCNQNFIDGIQIKLNSKKVKLYRLMTAFPEGENELINALNQITTQEFTMAYHR